MSRRCSVCSHEALNEIDRALVQLQPIRNLAELYELSSQALLRHRDSHLPAAIVQAQQAADVTRGNDLLAKLAAVESRITRALDRAEAAGNNADIYRGARELRECVRLLAELRGKLQSGTQVNVTIAQASPLSADELEHELELARALLAELRAQALAGAVTVDGYTLPAVTGGES